MNHMNQKRTDEHAGAARGAAAFAFAGAAVGPPEGLVGSAIVAMAGGAIGAMAGDAMVDSDEYRELFHPRYRTVPCYSSGSGRGWGDYEPAWPYGYDTHGKYQGRTSRRSSWNAGATGTVPATTLRWTGPTPVMRSGTRTAGTTHAIGRRQPGRPSAPLRIPRQGRCCRPAFMATFDAAVAWASSRRFHDDLMAHEKPTREEAEAAVRTLLSWAGDDPAREGLLDTPKRVVKAYSDWFSGYADDPREYLERTFEEVAGYDELIVLRDIEFESHCEHHMAPIIGKAHIGYLPDGKVVGISKLARVVEAYARRFQVQEKLTAQISDTINEVLQPRGVGVVIEGAHECMTTRGVHKRGVSMITSKMLGTFREDARTRAEFLQFIDVGLGR